MPQSIANVALHIVFSTKGRRPLLRPPELREELYAYMATVLRNNVDSPAILIGGGNHVHALVLLSRKFAIMKVLKKMRGLQTFGSGCYRALTEPGSGCAGPAALRSAKTDSLTLVPVLADVDYGHRARLTHYDSNPSASQAAVNRRLKATLRRAGQSLLWFEHCGSTTAAALFWQLNISPESLLTTGVPMPAQFKVADDSFKFESLMFSGGKERVTLNGQRVYEGMLTPDEPATFSAAGSDYEISKEKNAYRIRVTSGGETVSEGLYNPMGIEISDPDRAKGANAAGTCLIAGAALGVAFMVVGNILTGVIPGGAIGGGLGAGVGGVLGGAFGKAMFVKD